MGEGGRDRLRGFLNSSGRFAAEITAEIETNGYCVIEGVFSQAETEAAYNKMWRFIEKVAPGVHRSKPASWAAPGGVWPCARLTPRGFCM